MKKGTTLIIIFHCRALFRDPFAESRARARSALVLSTSSSQLVLSFHGRLSELINSKLQPRETAGMNVARTKKRACLSRFAIWCSYFISLRKGEGGCYKGHRGAQGSRDKRRGAPPRRHRGAAANFIQLRTKMRRQPITES